VDERPGRTLAIVAALTHLQLLGEFTLRAGSRVVLDESWKRGRAKSLLKLVALAPGHRLHREQVTEALWPELDPDAAMNQLYKSLHFLKAEMASFGLPSPLAIVDQHVSLGGAIDVDTDRFRRRAGLARRGETVRRRVAEAIAAYPGELLPSDRLEEWTTAPREELARLHRELLLELSRLEQAQGDDRAAIAALRQVLRGDATDEQAHRALMRLFASTGDRGQAIRQYHTCRDALRRELDVDPSPETEALHRAILEESVASAEAVGAARATLLEELADAMRRAGEVEHSTPLYEQALDVFQAAGDPQGALRVGGKAALGQLLRGDIAAATRLVEATRRRLDEQSPAYVTARTYYLLAQLRWHSGRYAEALAAAERSLAAALEGTDVPQQAAALEILALACHALGDWRRGVSAEIRRHSLAIEDGFRVDEAFEGHLCLWEYHLYGDRPFAEVERSVTEALAQAEAVGDLRAMAVCEHALGSLHFVTGRWHDSRDELARSVRLARAVGASQAAIIGEQRLGLLETAVGQSADGRRRLERVLAEARDADSLITHHHSRTRILAAIARTHLQAGALDDARASVDEAFAAQRDLGGCVSCDALLFPTAVPVYLATGAIDRASVAANEADATAGAFGSRGWVAAADHARGLLLAAQDDDARADASLSAAASTFARLGQPYDLARTLTALAFVRGRMPRRRDDAAGLRRRADELYRALGARPDPDRVRLVLFRARGRSGEGPVS
jgi:DNA-binding SARP family transcriptional activator